MMLSTIKGPSIHVSMGSSNLEYVLGNSFSNRRVHMCQ